MAVTAETKSRLSDPITLADPIIRGEEKISKIQLRKPKSGELRGLSLQDLMRSDATALITLIPRVAVPSLSPVEAAGLEPEDLAACAGAVIGFFMTSAEKAQMQAMLSA